VARTCGRALSYNLNNSFGIRDPKNREAAADAVGGVENIGAD
jgi:hypothetical protein